MGLKGATKGASKQKVNKSVDGSSIGQNKKVVTIRLDTDVIEFYKTIATKLGGKYQPLINDVLRSQMSPEKILESDSVIRKTLLRSEHMNYIKTMKVVYE